MPRFVGYYISNLCASNAIAFFFSFYSSLIGGKETGPLGYRGRKELCIRAKLKLSHRSLQFGELVAQYDGVGFQSVGLH